TQHALNTPQHISQNEQTSLCSILSVLANLFKAHKAEMKIRTLIVDDMRLARQRLRRCLASDPEIEIIGECANGQEAINAIKERAPDLVFLDVQMPKIGGFEVLAAIGVEQMPAVVFVTAYD